ncbi:unnamed protein product [Mytilus coruscus]|uniref:Uncharacterized protein n=1 Tax=Mytilus coruscus TaxID=42192 RepID=A0A6J8ECC7_MYTCO|nr:unnamed protein product [Mytilus coruscus]
MFLLDYQKKLENVYNTTEKSKRLKIPDPFPKFLLDVKREYYHMFNEKLLIPSNERSNKNKRQMIEANTVSIGSTRIYFGRTDRTNVMTPIHENELEFDKCLTGQCVDSCCTCHRSDSELSFLNHELNIECMMYETIEESKAIENCSGKEETQMNVLEQPALKSKIPVPVKLPPLTVNKKMKYMEKSSSTPLKLPILLPNKKMKNVEDSFSATLNPKPLLPNKNIQYVKEQSKTTLKLPPLLPDKKEISKQEKPFTNCLGTPKILQPLKMLPQNIKRH